MPSIPLPFVAALMLTVLLMRMISPWRSNKLDLASAIFVATCIAIEILSGERWSADLPYVSSARPIFAATLPPLAWISFGAARHVKALHLLPVVCVALLALLWRQFLDLGLAFIYVGYGIGLLHLAFQGPDAFPDIRLGESEPARRIAGAAGLLLLSLAVVDLLVASDFDFERGIHAASIVAVANVLIIVCVAVAIASVGKPTEDGEPKSARPTEVTPDDVNIAARIDSLMRERQLFRDPDLTLDRLSRRAGIPARQISAALNRVHGRNVSQVVNDYRVETAKRLLLETEASITHILFESGFQTKSNFNREFRRATGKSPREWRLSAVTSPSGCAQESE